MRLLTIYIPSSYRRNLHLVHMLRDKLTERGHTVLDWTAKSPPLSLDQTPQERLVVLNADTRGEVFDFCFDSATQADLVIYVGPSGQDASCEVAAAYVVGNGNIFGLLGPEEQPGTMLARMVGTWFMDVEHLLAGVDALVETLALSNCAED